MCKLEWFSARDGFDTRVRYQLLFFPTMKLDPWPRANPIVILVGSGGLPSRLTLKIFHFLYKVKRSP